MVLKRLKLHKVFDGVARTFSDTQAWVLEGGQDFENFSKKGYLLSFECGKKTNFPIFGPPTKTFGKIH